MHILLNLLSKIGVFLFFLLLQGIAVYLIVQKNESHAGFFGEKQTAITGSFNDKLNFVGRFFTLDAENQKLQKANARLESALREYQSQTGQSNLRTKQKIDTLDKVYTYTYVPAKIISNTIHKADNFIYLDKGSADGIRRGMGVATDNGIVGKIITTSKHFSAAQSVLHRQFRLSAQIKKSGNFGTLKWDGNTPEIVQLTEISRYIPTQKGDTIETYGARSIFPRNHPIGVIDSIAVNTQTNESDIRVRLFEPLNKLRYAYIIKNINAEEIIELEEVVDSLNQIQTENAE